MSLQALKALNVDKILDVEEAVALSFYARGLAEEYETLGLNEPGWLGHSTDVLREEIARRTKASRMALLKNYQTELESLKTAGERRADLQKKLASLQSELGLTSKSQSR